MTDNYIPAHKEKVYELIRLAQEGNEEARELLVRENAGLVGKVAKKFVREDYEYEDLMQMAYLGLIKAIDNFNSSFDVMFSTYAVPSIMGEIKRFLRDDGPIKISRDIKRDIRILKNAQNQFEIEKGRCPHISEVAKATGFTLEHVQNLYVAADESNISSLEGIYEEKGQEEMAKSSYSDDSQFWAERIDVKNEIMDLSGLEKNVIVLRYYCDMTQTQIADRLGISQVQVYRLEKRGISKLRDKLQDYCD